MNVLDRVSTRSDAMERDGDDLQLSTEEASGGVTQHGVRYVLAISLALAVILLSLAWIIPAATD
jgi:hypothetical protein